MNIEEYADALNLQIKLTYYPNQNNRWCASFEYCEFKDSPESSMLVNYHGNGVSPYMAISNFVKMIKGKVLVHDGMGANRREYRVPETLTMIYEEDKNDRP
jgi:hypothetical protein